MTPSDQYFGRTADDQPYELHPYQEWDAAYVLGALSPAERREFEEHLAGCESCRESVSELAALPGLLGALPPDEAFALLDAPVGDGQGAASLDAAAGSFEPPAQLTASLAHAARRRRRRTRGWVAAAFLTAAAVAAAAIVLPIALDRAPAPVAQTALAQTVPSSLKASVALVSKNWGTEISMDCSYAADSTRYATGGSYGLYVMDASGTATRVSSWHAWPGDAVELSGAVDIPEAQIMGVQVRDEASGTVLLASKL